MTKVFCAIDAPDLDSAAALVGKLTGLDIGIKLGLEFFVAEGLVGVRGIRKLVGDRAEIFLDLKLHDIPNTVAGAVRTAMACKPDFLTIHTSGGKDMMRAAVLAATDEAAKRNIRAPKILGVTVLTHLDDRDLDSVGQKGPVEEQVLRLAQLAQEAGLAGMVCSPHEIASLKKVMSKNFLLVVPGIRPSDSAAGDQKRIMTPEEAARLGADYLVIGRPITQAQDPAAVATKILSCFRKTAA